MQTMKAAEARNMDEQPNGRDRQLQLHQLGIATASA
jgi:hypothetical protein